MPCTREAETLSHRHDGGHTSNKKSKKTSVGKAASSSVFDPDDIAALNRRAARFQREHEIERQKSSRSFSNGNHNSSSSYASHANTHLFKSRSGTPAAYDAADEPEANPVSP